MIDDIWRSFDMKMKTLAIAGMVSLLTIMPAKKIVAQDTTRLNVDDGKELVLKPHLGLKGFGRAYDGGKTAGIGLGVEPSLDVGKVSIGGSFSPVKEGDKARVKESGVWASAPVGKTNVVAYAYQDLFFQAPALTYGAAASGYGMKAGAEIAPYSGADGFWDAYVKVPRGSFTPGVTVVGWGSDGWKGGPKKIALIFAVQHRIAEKLKLTTETSYGKMFSGGDGSLRFRVTASYSPF